MRRRLLEAGLASLLLVPLLPGTARAADYEMSTTARYAVDPSAGEISARVEVTFTNTFPDPPGQISAFTHVDLAIQDGASAVVADDGSGALHVDVATRNGARIASVRTRTRVRYNRSVSFTLAYRLADGAAPDLHVRREIVKFAAWGFGTSSEVSVELPAGYQARADGDPMLTDIVGSNVVLSSGPIADPAHWLTLVTAVHPGELVTHAASVPLATGTVDLQVRAWSDDARWGERTLALLVEALPMLEQAIGLPYPRVGPLLVTEAAGGETSSGTTASATAEIQAAFDGDAFTLLHQAAHIWIGDQLTTDRWIREGLASHYAALVAARLHLDLPYDPAARTSELGADARPLIEWTPGLASRAEEAYGYAASWSLVDRIAKSVGEAPLGMTLRRITAGLSAYDPGEPDPSSSDGRPFLAVDTRGFLDQLAAATGVDLSDAFANGVFSPVAASELEQRRAARAAYARLLTTAGDWGAPEPVRSAMEAWRFDEAQRLISQASAWLARRDAFLVDAAAADLVPPDRLRMRYALSGGGSEAVGELAAERKLVATYLSLDERARAPRGLLDAAGLLFAEDPREVLGAAAGTFASGALGASADALDRAELLLDRAPSDGAERLAAMAVLLAVVGLVAGVALRHRTGTNYTARP